MKFIILAQTACHIICLVVFPDREEDDDGYSYKDMVLRDERRWQKADEDGDGLLTKEEFANFLHPEDAAHMRDIVIDVSGTP